MRRLTWYRLLLWVLPRSFRLEFGADMIDALRQRWTANPGLGARSHTVRSALSDLAATFCREWLQLLWPQTVEHQLRDPNPIVVSAPARAGSPSRLWSVFDRLAVVLRHTHRRLSRQWGTSLLIVATLGLGVGATVAIYSYVNAALVRPLPFDQPDRLVRVWPGTTFSKEVLDQFRERSSVYEAVAGYSGWLVTLTGAERSDEIKAIAVGPGYFDVLRVNPSLGRTLQDADSAPGAEPVVVLSDELWRTRFGADHTIIGRLIDFGALDGAAKNRDRRRVVGVMPAQHEGIVSTARLWFPLEIDPADEEDYGGSWYLSVVARLADDISHGAAAAELDAVAQGLREDDYLQIGDDEAATAHVVPLRQWMTQTVQRPLLILLGAVALVLLIGCTNVASLLIARAASRRDELKLRAALGANRRRLLLELLSESAVLAVAGGLLGLALAVGIERIVAYNLPSSVPRLGRAGLDLPVLAFSLALTMMVALLSGLPSALRAARSRGVGAGPTRTAAPRVDERMQLSLVVVEVALSVVLLVGAGLVLKSFDRLLRVDPGFDATGVTAMRVLPPAPKYETTEAWQQVNRDLQEQIASVPGVTGVGGIHLLPLNANNWSFPYSIDGQVLAEGEATPSANYRVVAGDYFEVMSIPILAGRRLNELDRAGSEDVVVINATFARELWGVEQSVGKTLNLFMNQPHTIVGVVGDVHQLRLDLEVQPEMYYPVNQKWATGNMALVVRSDRESASLYPELREALRSVDPAIAIGDLMPMDEAIGRSVAQQRSMSMLLTGFGALAVFLSLVGVYGVMAYLAARRVREMGIRMALGAGRTRVLSDGLKKAGQWILLGLALGALGAIGAGRLVGGLLYEVDAHDLTVLGTVVAGVAVCAGLASLVPLRRASRCDPAKVLRSE